MNYLQVYQKAHGFSTDDGVIGKETVATMMQDLGIQDTVAFCHFIAQIKHESNNFTAGRENLNYSIEGLKKYFSYYFKPDEYRLYARQPEKIANRVYANRMGNGDEVSGDGWKYRGNGALQLTGKTNHLAYFKHVRLPPDTNPNVLLQPEHYFRTAKFYFDFNNVWQFCTDTTKECVVKVSKKINLGNANSPTTPMGLDARLILSDNLFTQFC